MINNGKCRNLATEVFGVWPWLLYRANLKHRVYHTTLGGHGCDLRGVDVQLQTATTFHRSDELPRVCSQHRLRDYLVGIAPPKAQMATIEHEITRHTIGVT
ncbi:hypothetical protein UU5_08023 [Rhodanobacter sp. 115]|nr:hypothetical protein UU5_08023 [Rhodanobacter sp. 115]